MDSTVALQDRCSGPPEGSVTGKPASSLVVESLSLANFRSYAQASIELDARPVVLTGENGAGKTNLLEAVSFLAPGRGLRRARLSEVERREAGWAPRSEPAAESEPQGHGEPWVVTAQVATPEGRRRIGTGRDPQAETGSSAGSWRGTGRRVVKIDGILARTHQQLGEVMRIVWLTPQMDDLFRAGSSERRRFLDRLVYSSDPNHAARLSAYEHALRERARLLREGRREPAWLTALEHEMAEYGIAVAAARRLLVDRLSAACDSAVGPFPKAELDLTGDLDLALRREPALAVEEAFRARLEHERPLDAESGGARSGPHRSDLLVRHHDKGLTAGLCSTGEQKALLVAITLAHARLVAFDRGAAPLLLLDEVIAHLDETRRRGLFAALLGLGAQSWLTGTDGALFAPLGDGAQFFRIRDGEVLPL